MQKQQESASTVRNEARKLLLSMKESEDELQKIEYLEFCPHDSIWMVAERSAEDDLRGFLMQQVRCPQMYHWLDLLCCHSSELLESVVEMEAKEQALSEDHFKYYLRFLKV